MFSQRIFAICVLVFYGVPAAVGPSWHRHGVTCLHSESSSTTACQVSSAVANDCHEHCHLEDSSESISAPEAGEQTQNELCVLSSKHDHDCAICAFYAQAQLTPFPNIDADFGDLVATADDQNIPAPWWEPFFQQARGPPSYA